MLDPTDLATSDDIAREVRAIGVREGDMVLLRCSLRAIGGLEPDNATALIDGMLAAVGASGTLLALAHSGVTSRRRADPDTPFNRTSRAITGGFANALIDRPEAKRSSHPTHSIVAIGAEAMMITRYHDEVGTCFGFVQKLVERDDPMMLIGCTESGPGFSTVDFAQLELGMAYRTAFIGKVGAYRETDNGTAWFQRHDHPGCSRGFGNLYRHYLADQLIAVGHVGQAYSMIGRSAALFDTDRRVLEAAPREALCNDLLCYSCRVTRRFNKRDIPAFIVRRGAHVARRRLRS